MKHPLLIIIVLLCFLAGLPGAFAQQKERKFTRSYDAYAEELAMMFAETPNKRFQEKGEQLMEQFNSYWSSPFYTKELREKIYDLSDLMLEKRMYAYPRFYDFISCLVYLGESRLEKESIDIWLVRAEYIARNSPDRDYGEFLERSLEIFKDKILYTNQSRTWYFQKGKYTFSYDTAFLVHFEEIDLIGRSRNDSTVIYGTKGVLHPERNTWTGEGGIINWNRVGLDEETVYVKLRDYKIDISLIRYRIDSVEFHNTDISSEPMLGSLEERVSSSSANERTSFPRFDSYFKDYNLANLFDDIDGQGGIAMFGKRVIINADEDKYATLYFNNKKGDDIRFRANEFIAEDNRINAERAEFVMFHGPDSLHHPGIQVRYDMESNVLELIQSNPGNRRVPFYDSFHMMNIYSETLVWDLNEKKLAFKAIQSVGNESQVVFESDEFFSEYEFFRLQGVDVKNPLDVIKDFTEDYGTMDVSPEVLAEYIRKPVEQAMTMLLVLESKGFVEFDPEIEVATVKQRLFDYLDAKAGYIDWDVIRFESVTRLQSNAEIDLETFNMEVLGVQEVTLSYPQKVYIYPYEGNLTMTEGKDFFFSGQVKAGLFEFYTHDCFFDYDSFNLKMPDIDSVSFYVRLDSLNKEGKQMLKKVRSVIEDLNGYIIIEEPNNKSAAIKHPHYPMFVCESNAFVYYDDSFIRKGVYDRETFYYELDPFMIDSLDNFTTDGIRFKGYFESAGIFPVMNEDLVVMPDYSLGFETTTPEGGSPLYGPLATFEDTIYLNTDGLTGDGVMKFLNSTSVSEEFIFYPDSLRALVESFVLEEAEGAVEYPQIEGYQIDETLLPDTGILVLENTASPFSVFANESEFDGTLFLSEGMVDGKGFYIFENATIASNQFNLKHHEIAADTSYFCLYTDSTSSDTAFLASEYRSKVDFQDRIGRFLSQGENSLLEFPFNQYVCTMDELEWKMDDYEMIMNNHTVAKTLNLDEVDMYAMMDLDLTGSEFISVHPEQDSLKFFTVRARYDMVKNIIYAEDVRIIKVADAAIFPRDGLVTIQENAMMETLKNAYIVADTINKYHTIHNANVNINSRHDYLARGFYDYVDYAGQVSRMRFDYVGVDSLGVTHAAAVIDDTANFMLSPKIYFTGNIRLDAPEEFLYFDGGYRITQDCYAQPEYWVKFDTVVNPNSLVLPVPEKIYDIYGDRLHASLNYSRLKKGFYPCFLVQKWNDRDVKVLEADGFMGYNQNTSSFIISNVFFSESPVQNEQVLYLDETDCTLKGEGKLDLAIDMPYIDIGSFGQANYMLIPDSTQFRLVMGIDFYLEQDLMEMVTESLDLANLRGINVNTDLFAKALRYFVNPEDAKKYREDIQLYGIGRKIPQELRYTMFIADLNMVWNPSTHSYISKGDIGIANMGEVPINKYVNGYIEIGLRGAGDYMNIYLEVTKGLWYFFTYRNFIMQSISSDEAYNTLLFEMKEDDRIIKDRREEGDYELVISTKRKRIEFIREMEKIFGY